MSRWGKGVNRGKKKVMCAPGGIVHGGGTVLHHKVSEMGGCGGFEWQLGCVEGLVRDDSYLSG